MGGFPKIRGTLFGGPHNKDYGILESVLGSPYFGKLLYLELTTLVFACLLPEAHILTLDEFPNPSSRVEDFRAPLKIQPNLEVLTSNG